MTRRSFLKNIAGALDVLSMPVAAKALYQQKQEKAMAPRYNLVDGEFVQVSDKTRLGFDNPAYHEAKWEQVMFKHPIWDRG